MSYRGVALWLFCTLFSLWQYLILSFAACGDCPARVEAIVAGRAPAPFAYRVLVPYVLTALGNSVVVWVLWQLLWLGVFYALLWQWARYWQVSPALVLLLAALVVALMIPTLYFSAYKILEWNLWLGGWLLLLRCSSSAHSPAK